MNVAFTEFHKVTVTPSRVCELKLACTLAGDFDIVTPSRVCELKFLLLLHWENAFVTPSRVCELKFPKNTVRLTPRSHTLTGV